MAASTATHGAAKRLRNGGHNSIHDATNCSNGWGENHFPNWSARLLDFPFPHAEPDAFARLGENLDFISADADFIAPHYGAVMARLDAAGWPTGWRSRAQGAQSVIV
jgi:hypothetical protein